MKKQKRVCISLLLIFILIIVPSILTFFLKIFGLNVLLVLLWECETLFPVWTFLSQIKQVAIITNPFKIKHYVYFRIIFTTCQYPNEIIILFIF